MDKQYFLSTGIPPLHFQPSLSSSPMSTWRPIPYPNCEKSTTPMNSIAIVKQNSPFLSDLGRLSRNSSGSPIVQENNNSAANSSDNSYTQNDSKNRKRKPVPKEESQGEDNSNAKRPKLTKENVKTESNEGQKQAEAPKDYIHVRARRGQATDSHSLAERVRREKISERMKLLQDLVPGCNKVTGKAPMLDEIINYVQSLQHQVEFLSMKLASVNPSLDFNMDSLLSKDIFQPAGSLHHPNYYPHQNPQGLVDPFQLPVDGFGEGLPQFPTFFEDDLQSIFQMGFGGNPNKDTALPLQIFPASNQASSTKY